MDYGNKCSGTAMGPNAGGGNRAAAAHIKGLHKSGNAVSSTAKPSMAPGSGSNHGSPLSGKKPRRSISKSSALMD